MSKAARIYKIDRQTVKRLIDAKAKIIATKQAFEFRAGEKVSKLSDQRKLELIHYAELHGQTKTSKEIDVSRSTIIRLMKQKAKLIEKVNTITIHRYIALQN